MGCPLTYQVFNQFDVPIKIDKIKTAAAPFGTYKTKWDGNRSIPAGHNHTFHLEADLGCFLTPGIERGWHIKIVRANGKVHKCNLSSNDVVIYLRKPDVCVRNSY